MFRTLIVEDNLQFRKSMLQTLRGRFPFMHFSEVDDGEHALEAVDRWRPHLIFMDVSMPSVNGLELTRTIKRMHGDVVVIVLTSYDLPDYGQEAAAAAPIISSSRAPSPTRRYLPWSIRSSRHAPAH